MFHRHARHAARRASVILSFSAAAALAACDAVDASEIEESEESEIEGGAVESSALPAFPGAEGFGAGATGGRGGRVIKVTTLAASGPGSLQEALDVAEPRIIVFAVSGVIEGDVTVRHGDVTIAGQTAPGAGITLKGRLIGAYDASVGNIVVRFLRVRPEYDGSAGHEFDGVQFSLNQRLMLDHLSISGGVDETVDVYESRDVTIQWSIIEESGQEGHYEGEHNYGLIHGPDGRRIAVHHNLFAHHKNRNPAISTGPAEIRNNVAYNVRHGFVHHNPAEGQFNIVGNSYIRGPNNELIPFFLDEPAGPGLSYHIADSFIDDPEHFTGVLDDPWETPRLHPSLAVLSKPVAFRSAEAFDFTEHGGGFVPITTQSSTEAYALVLEKAGAFPRDVVTRRVLREVEERGGSWGAKDCLDLMEGLTPGEPPEDTDGDGMPDAWEVELGLDPSDGDDHDTVMPSGYTAIEEYINELAAELTGDASDGAL